MNKKGAVEFSMTTIMVIIIGVAVLALALTWVSGTFTQVGELTDTAFDQAKTQLAGELSASNRILVSPSSLNLGANDQKTVSVGCYNDGAETSATLGDTWTDTGGKNSNVVVQKSEGSTVIPNGKAFWGMVVKANPDVTSAKNPEVITLTIDCSGQPETRALTVTYK